MLRSLAPRSHWPRGALLAAVLATTILVLPSVSSAATPTLEGPLPGAPPGNPAAPVLSETYPFFSTWLDLAAEGYVEQEFYLSGLADAYATSGAKLGSDVPYTTRIIVRRPISQADFNGTVLVEWQNVTAGYDLDALWNWRHMREGYVWVGVSAQRVGVNQLSAWSPTRYGTLDVTGGGAFVTDQLSYDIFAQAAQALQQRGAVDPLAGLDVERVLAIGASQSAGRMTVYYNVVLPQETAVFDGYAFIVGAAPSRVGPEPVFQVLSETDVQTPLGRRPDSDVFRRWEVAGAAHSGWEGQEYRRPLSIRDLGAAPVYECTNPPFSRVLAEPGDRGGLRPSGPLGGRSRSAAARAVPGVHGHDEGAERARPRARRHPALPGRRADGAQHRLQLGAVVLRPLRHARALRRRAARGALPEPRQLRVGGRRDRRRERRRRLPAAG